MQEEGKPEGYPAPPPSLRPTQGRDQGGWGEPLSSDPPPFPHAAPAPRWRPGAHAGISAWSGSGRSSRPRRAPYVPCDLSNCEMPGNSACTRSFGSNPKPTHLRMSFQTGQSSSGTTESKAKPYSCAERPGRLAG